MKNMKKGEIEEFWRSRRLLVPTMSLACLVCHSVERPSPSHSFRSYSVSSAENEGRCYAIANCLTKKSSLPTPAMNSFLAPSSSSKVTPQPSHSEMPVTPRLVRSCAVRRDLVRDWNFDEFVRELRTLPVG